MSPSGRATATPRFTLRWYTTWSSPSEALRIGNSPSASIAAWAKKGIRVSRTPARSSKAGPLAARTATTRDMSTSNTVVTCAEVRRERIM